MGERGVLHAPLTIGGTTTVRNRLYRAPVLEGAGDGDDCVDRYARQFVENARHGIGLIIQGSSCLYEEGRTSPGMTLVHTRERTLRPAPMVEAVHAEGAAIITCTVKVPVGEKAPPFTPRTTWDEGLRLAQLCGEWGYDSVTPVEVSAFPDTTLSRGGIPTSLWRNKAITGRFPRRTAVTAIRHDTDTPRTGRHRRGRDRYGGEHRVPGQARRVRGTDHA